MLSRGRIAIALGLAALAALVGVGSRPSQFGPGGPVPPSAPFELMFQTGLDLAVALVVLVTAGLVYTFLREDRGKRESQEAAPESVAETPRIPRALMLAMLLLPCVLIVGLIVAVSHIHPGLIQQPSGLPTVLPGTPHPAAAAGSADSALPWISLGVVALVLVAGLLTWLVSERRIRMRWQVRGPDVGETVSEAIEEGLEALLTGPDPRQAVIGAYLVMERAFARAGRARRHFEAPFEFVGRILSSVPGAVTEARKLTELFELAKFSRHEVDEDMRREAVGALSKIRIQIRPPA